MMQSCCSSMSRIVVRAVSSVRHGRRPVVHQNRPFRRVITRLSTLAAALLLTGCSVTVTGGGAPVIDTAGWTRSANYTTCDQWLGEMTPAQRAAMMRPLLPYLRRTVDTAATDGLELVPAFVDAVSATCQTPDIQSYDEYFITAAAALAFDERFQPK